MKKKVLITALTASLVCAAAAVAFAACGEETLYSVTYAGGGTQVTGTAPTEVQHKKDDKFALKDNTFTNTGFEFVGWTYNNVDYEAGAQFTMPASDVTFTAKWEELFTVTYSLGAESHAATGVTAPASKVAKSGTLYALPTLEAETNYMFAGWKVGATETVLAAGAQYTVTGNITLTATWKLSDTINIPTVTATTWYENRFLAEYPEKIKQGDVLTVEGTVNLTASAPLVHEGILVAIADNAKANFSQYRYDRAINGDWNDHSANNDDHKLSVGFTDFVTKAWFADYKALIAEKQLAYKAVVDYTAHNVIVVSYYLTASFAEVTGGTDPAFEYATAKSEHTFYITYLFGNTQDAEFVVALGGENATLTGGTVTKSNKPLSEVTVSADQTNIEVGSASLDLAFTRVSPVWVSNKLNAGDKLEITGTLAFNTGNTYFVPIVNLFENSAGNQAFWRTDDWVYGFQYVGLTANQVKGDPAFNSNLTSGGTCKITIDWTTATQIVISLEYKQGESVLGSTTLTVTGMPTGVGYYVGLGGEGIHYTATAVKTTASAN